jgi:hypothetical protein
MLIDQQWLEIPSESIEYRSLDGDTGETNGAHWCGGEIADPHIAMLYTYCAFLPPNLSSLQQIPRKYGDGSGSDEKRRIADHHSSPLPAPQ